MRFKKTIFYLLLFFGVAKVTFAQQRNVITGKFENTSFENFVTQIESKTNYIFYYNSKQTDSLVITVNANNNSLEEVLKNIFEKTVFQFSIDETQRVFITRQQRITTTLPQFFFMSGNVAANNFSLADTITDAESVKTKYSIAVAEENKFFEIGNRPTGSGINKATIAGYVKEKRNGEAIAGAIISADSGRITVVTDQFGYYNITLSKGRHTVKINSAGMKDTKRNILLNSNGKLDIDLYEYVASLKTVVVSTEKKSNTQSLLMGSTRLNIKAIKQVPVLLGETDIIKVILTLPGVTSVGEASNGFNVRGGAADQNLILLNDATIYNPSHLFGLFSAFNADAVKNVELYKSAIPEKYGGRISSVLDVTMKNGNTKKWTGSGGIGPLTSKFTLDGPLKKDKTSVTVGGRTTYSNWLLQSLKNTAYRNSKAAFSDFNFNLAHNANSKNSFFITGYYSSDKFTLNNDTTYRYSNKNINIKWKHIFNNNFSGLISSGADSYNYSVLSKAVPINSFKLGFNINQFYARSIFNYNPNNKHTINFGVTSIYYKLQPGSFTPQSAQSLVQTKIIPVEQAVETAVFAGDQITINSKFAFNAGIRYSMYNYLGPKQVYSYLNNFPRTVNTVTDSITYGKGKNIKTWSGPEVRASLRYTINENTSVKISYNSLLQYIHMLSNTTSISPTDIWKLSDTYIKPQMGQQIAAGLYKNFKSNSIETSLEFYYKKTNNYLDFKSGASLLLNKQIETEIINTHGKVYGAEFLLKKTTGRLNGWISYSYSKAQLQINDNLAGETINDGNYYPASFDKPHSVNIITNYRFSHRYSISANFTYTSGRPITLPLAVFNNGGASALFYSNRNQYRIPDYMRADFSVNMDGNHKVNQRVHNSWSLGVYNLLARQNVYSVYFTNENGRVKGYQLSILGTAIPFITYNFRF
jgi:hypothetical protein